MRRRKSLSLLLLTGRSRVGAARPQLERVSSSPVAGFWGETSRSATWRAGACVASLLAHVEEAEARQTVMHEQLLLDKLMFHLTQLHGSHFAPVGREFSRGMLLESDE